eukprot:7504587-Lingulodinium_polyedra.AAC.1
MRNPTLREAHNARTDNGSGTNAAALTPMLLLMAGQKTSCCAARRYPSYRRSVNSEIYMPENLE